MKFHFGDRVFVKSGFHRGLHGRVIARRLFRYAVSFGEMSLWFWPWQISKSFTIQPVDNTKTMENVRRAQEIIKAAEMQAATP